MSDLQKHINNSLNDVKFKEEWDRLEPEFDLVRTIIAARIEQGYTQAELARRCGMKPANLCRIEQGRANPSVSTLERIAAGLGKTLKISFI